jgi:hypothetical protein
VGAGLVYTIEEYFHRRFAIIIPPFWGANIEKKRLTHIPHNNIMIYSIP